MKELPDQARAAIRRMTTACETKTSGIINIVADLVKEQCKRKVEEVRKSANDSLKSETKRLTDLFEKENAAALRNIQESLRKREETIYAQLKSDHQSFQDSYTPAHPHLPQQPPYPGQYQHPGHSQHNYAPQHPQYPHGQHEVQHHGQQQQQQQHAVHHTGSEGHDQELQQELAGDRDPQQQTFSHSGEGAFAPAGSANGPIRRNQINSDDESEDNSTADAEPGAAADAAADEGAGGDDIFSSATGFDKLAFGSDDAANAADLGFGAGTEDAGDIFNTETANDTNNDAPGNPASDGDADDDETQATEPAGVGDGQPDDDDATQDYNADNGGSNGGDSDSGEGVLEGSDDEDMYYDDADDANYAPEDDYAPAEQPATDDGSANEHFRNSSLVRTGTLDPSLTKTPPSTTLTPAPMQGEGPGAADAANDLANFGLTDGTTDELGSGGDNTTGIDFGSTGADTDFTAAFGNDDTAGGLGMGGFGADDAASGSADGGFMDSGNTGTDNALGGADSGGFDAGGFGEANAGFGETGAGFGEANAGFEISNEGFAAATPDMGGAGLGFGADMSGGSIGSDPFSSQSVLALEERMKSIVGQAMTQAGKDVSKLPATLQKYKAQGIAGATKFAAIIIKKYGQAVAEPVVRWLAAAKAQSGSPQQQQDGFSADFKKKQRQRLETERDQERLQEIQAIKELQQEYRDELAQLKTARKKYEKQVRPLSLS